MASHASIEADAHASKLDLIRRYYNDRAYRESLPCGECSKVGGCVHFPSEAQA